MMFAVGESSTVVSATRVSWMLGVLVGLALGSPTAIAGPVEFSADAYSTNFDTQITRARGNVRVVKDSQVLTANDVELRGLTGQVEARGGFDFREGTLHIRGSSAVLDLNTGVGVFEDAVLRAEGRVFVEAKKLERKSATRFEAEQGKVSTCMDCPQAWSVVGTKLSVEVEGYAQIHHALFQVKNLPVAYFPVFVFPVKTERQSGFLIPQYNYSKALGHSVSQSYFWAISKDKDFTGTLGWYSDAGTRAASEFRWDWSNRSRVYLTASYLRNDRLKDVADDRFGFSVEAVRQINSFWTARVDGEAASDALYTTHFPSDFKGSRLSHLQSEPSVSWQSANLFSMASATFYRDNIPRGQILSGSVGPLHRFPLVEFSVPSRSLFFGGPLFSLQSNVLHQSRRGSAVDPTTGWVREGTRYSQEAVVRWPFHATGVLLYEPSAKFRADAYRFDAQSGVANSAGRFRWALDQTVSADVWRVYRSQVGDLRALRHSITPKLRWSYAPEEKRSTHPFFRNDGSPKFDLYDPFSDASKVTFGSLAEEQRLGKHHLLTPGIETRLVGRFGDTQRRYEEFFGAGVYRDWDLYQKKVGRWNIKAFAAVAGFKASSEIAYDSVEKVADVRNDVSYTKPTFSVAAFQVIRPDAEAVGARAELSKVGPFLFRLGGTYDQLAQRASEQFYEVAYNSPSKCWYLSLGVTRTALEEDFNIAPVFRLSFSEAALSR